MCDRMHSTEHRFNIKINELNLEIICWRFVLLNDIVIKPFVLQQNRCKISVISDHLLPKFTLLTKFRRSELTEHQSIQRSTLGVCQRAMKQSILGLKLVDGVNNITITSITKITDATPKAATLKCNQYPNYVTYYYSQLESFYIITLQVDTFAACHTINGPNLMANDIAADPDRDDERNSFDKEWSLAALEGERWKENSEGLLSSEILRTNKN